MSDEQKNGSSTAASSDTALELAAALREGRLSAVELADACLKHIAAHEDDIHAWACLDPKIFREQAENADKARSRGQPLGPLHGLPVGIKDIIDVAGMPTTYNSPIYSGRRPVEDASMISLLREAGAIIAGKTVTTELAMMKPAETRNPHNLGHTPGGSSAGSAAAVAAGMVPLSIGTQTGGSVIRPASFCGVYGFKPSHGRISRHRVLRQSSYLDTIGVFARTLGDMALIADVLMAYDSRDPGMRMNTRPCIAEIMAEDPPDEPKFAFVRSPVWDEAEASTKEAFRELVEHLGERVDLVKLPTSFDYASEFHRRIMDADIAQQFEKEYSNHNDQLSDNVKEIIERGRKVSAVEYIEAVESIAEFNDILELMLEDYDAIITPSALGEAPEGFETTGDPAFCKIWTLCGVPAINLPILEGPKGLPLGVQLVSHKDDDARLFRTARWLLNSLEA
ncbi:MAG: amidase [Rhizobiales bacterium]|nr:amidase [Hyphomicrobiales bacterium]